MAYGLQVFGSTNNNVLIDTNLESQMQITSSGTHSASTNLSIGTDEIVVWNRAYPSSGFAFSAFRQSYQSTNIFNGSSTVDYSYAKIKSVIQSTPPTRPAGDYGIEIKNPSGTVSFSDLFTKSFDIINIYSPGTVTGGNVIYSGANVSDIYVGAGQPQQGTDFSYNNFTWVKTNNTIEFRCFFTFFGFTTNLVNSSTVVVAQLRN